MKVLVNEWMMKARTLYFDYNATTPVDPSVLETMIPFFTENYGNSMSLLHSFGWTASDAVEKARHKVAQFLNCSASDLFWTSGATESNNWVIQSLLETAPRKDSKFHILSSPLEHNSILQTLKHVSQTQRADVEYLALTPDGTIDLEDLKKKLKPTTGLVCAMWIQNEIGSINPMKEISQLCRANKTLLLTDATQAVGKVPIDLKDVHVDFLSLSGHKFYGPKGVGVLYRRRSEQTLDFQPLIFGGGHENGLRSGTLNVPGIVGTARAIELCQMYFQQENERITNLRKKLFEDLLQVFPKLRLNGPPLDRRSPNNLNVTFCGIELPENIPGIAFSRGSACMSGKTTTSHVLQALGIPESEAKSTLRLSLGRWTELAHITEATEIIRKTLS